MQIMIHRYEGIDFSSYGISFNLGLHSQSINVGQSLTQRHKARPMKKVEEKQQNCHCCLEDSIFFTMLPKRSSKQVKMNFLSNKINHKNENGMNKIKDTLMKFTMIPMS